MSKPRRTPARDRRPTSAPVPTPPNAGEGKRGSEGHIGYLLRQAQAAFRAAAEAALAPLGLTLAQFGILTLARAYGPLSGAELARLAVLTPQTIDTVSRALVRAGWLERRPDPLHGRIVRLGLTPAGARVLAAAKPRVAAVERRAVAGLAAAEEAIVRRWLAGLARDLLPRG